MYKINKEKIFYDTTADTTVAINQDTGIYYSINGLSSEVFNFIVKGAKTDDILAALQAIPDAPADIEERLNVFVNTLLDLQMFIPADSVALEIQFNPELAVQDNFTLSFIEFSDAQEMLLADPITEYEYIDYENWKPEIEK
ncbi:MAG: PqqD family protein [Paludibacter sp.]|jgi:hypothetical protein|nr:PqqD family protein [Paludibacter sp.]